jgi:hypothetical protein
MEFAIPIVIGMEFSERWRARFIRKRDDRLAQCVTAQFEGRRMFLAR